MLLVQRPDKEDESEVWSFWYTFFNNYLITIFSLDRGSQKTKEEKCRGKKVYF